MRSLYSAISQRIEQDGIRTITVDIFDTVLFRKIWPEDLQFLVVAEKWLPRFREVFDADISAYKIYSWRQYARSELFAAFYSYKNNREQQRGGGEFDVNLRSWFEAVVDLFSNIYDKRLSKADRRELVEYMISVELATERENLYVNREVVDALQAVRRNYPDVKIFYASDMYLTGVNLDQLLAFFGVEVFDGGVASTDFGAAKHDAKLFYKLQDSKILCDDFDIFANLHVGDNMNSDVKMADAAGSFSIFYHPIRLRRFREKYGARKLQKLQKRVHKLDNTKLRRELSEKTNKKIWQSYGELFSQPLYSFLFHVGVMARECPGVNFLMVSSEATSFAKFGREIAPGLFAQKNIAVAAKLNRRMILRALVYLLSRGRDKKFNAKVIERVINLGEVDGSRREVYRFFFGKEYPFSEMVVNNRDEKTFYEAFLEDIKTADEKYTRILRDSYEYVTGILSRNTYKKIVIVDVGWGGTVQQLFSEFVRLRDDGVTVEGLYLGCHPADRFDIKTTKMIGYLLPNVRDTDDRDLWNAPIWEYAYTNKAQFLGDTAHLEQIAIGFKKGEALFRTIDSNPKDYFSSVSKREIRRFIKRPTAKEAKTVGGIVFDMGFVSEGQFRICDTRRSFLGFYINLLRHPRTVMKETIFYPNSWSNAYIRFYHLGWLKFMLKIYGKLRGKRYI